MNHVVHVSDLLVRIADEREIECLARHVLDVLRPAAVGIQRIDAQADDLRVTLLEFRLQLRDGAELGGAHGGEITRM